ncbi:choice-of-anchor M domain-containing protein [Streptomyces sp. NPDC013740]|uniref:choice-of-anchor M domain-containing protein n=1 Tax=Streptomyces sp. NPDC013740 TaxID=3364867 RepID=UPI0036FFE8D1
MRPVHHGTTTALAAASALALAGTAAAIPPASASATVPPAASPAASPAAKPAAGPAAIPVLAPVTVTGNALNLGPDVTLDLDDSHRVTGPDGVTRWETDAAWDTTGVGTGAPVHWALTAVEGPGAVRVLEVPAGAAESLVRFDSGDGLPDGCELPAGSRGATRWEFDAPGTYRLTFAARGAVDGSPATAEVHHTVVVGGEPETGPETGPGPGPETGPELPDAVAAPPAPAPTARPAQGRRTARALAADEPVETSRKVLDEGHVDIAARLVGGRLQIHVKDGTVPGKSVWREPSSVVLRVKPQARKTIPAHKDFAFLGRAGGPVWLLDQVQQPGLLWPGWSTDNVPAGALRGDVEFKLVKAEGPGGFALYNYDGLSGATVRFNSADGVPDAFGVPQNTHAHGGWAFGKEGAYRLTVTMSGTRADGARVSDTETLAFAVGETSGGTPGATGGATGSATDGTSTGGTASGGRADAGPSAGAPAPTSTTGTPTSGSDPASRGAMASTGAGTPLLLGGAAVALAAAGAAAVRVARRRSA